MLKKVSNALAKFISPISPSGLLNNKTEAGVPNPKPGVQDQKDEQEPHDRSPRSPESQPNPAPKSLSPQVLPKLETSHAESKLSHPHSLEVSKDVAHKTGFTSVLLHLLTPKEAYRKLFKWIGNQTYKRFANQGQSGKAQRKGVITDRDAA